MRPTAMVRSMLGAAQFLTRVPISLREAPDLATCVPWFPTVGLAIGAAVGGLAAGLMEVVPPSVAAAIAVLAGVMLTGAFHEDGLADASDAMGGWTQEQRRQILKDSRHGSYGVAAMCGSIVLRILCVAAMPPAVAVSGLVAAHGLGRCGAVGVMIGAPPAPTAGLGADYIRTLSRPSAAIGVIAGVAGAALAVGWWIGPLVAGVAAASLLVAIVARRAFGSINGDVLGAVEQVGEIVVLVTVSGLALHHSLWWR